MILTPIAYLLLGWLLVRRAFLRATIGESSALSFPLAIALFLVSLGLSGHWITNFKGVILAGSLTCLALAFFLFIGTKNSSKSGWSFQSWNGWRLLWILVAAATTILIALVARRFAFFDELAMQGHLPVVESMLRGHFPPTYVAFPEVPYRYHYGFNMLAAYFSLLGRLPGWIGIDLATLAYWLAFLGILPVFFRRFGVGERGFALGFILLTLTGGLSWLLSRHDPGLNPVLQNPDWQQMFVYGRALHPQFMMYLFQHPMGMGLCLFLGLILAFSEWFETSNHWSLAVGILQLGALSLAQVVLFGTALASLALVFSWRRRWIAGAVVGVLGIALALGLGGFFSVSPRHESQPLLFSWPPNYLAYEYWGGRLPMSFVQGLIWYLGSFGLFLFLFPLIWIFALRRREFAFIFLALFGILCFLVPQFFRYSYSWDIIKWYFGFELSGKLLLVMLALPWALRRRWREILIWGLVLFSAYAPFSFLKDLALSRSFTRNQMRVASFRQPQLLDPWRTVTDFILNSTDPWGRVWANPNSSHYLSLFTGLPMVQLDRNTQQMPLSRRLIQERRRAIENLSKSPSWEALRGLEVKWLVFTCEEVRRDPVLQEFLEEIGKRPEVLDLSLRESGSCFHFYRILAAQ